MFHFYEQIDEADMNLQEVLVSLNLQFLCQKRFQSKMFPSSNTVVVWG